MNDVIPTAISSFVGRAEEVASLSSHVRTERLITLTGSGGCGKTRLAFEMAAALHNAGEVGAVVVELGAVASPDQVAAELAEGLGLREIFGVSLLDTLAEQLHDFAGVLVLDNCEQVIDGVRAAVEHLLSCCPSLRVLATSREPLGIVGEVTWRVPSLDTDMGVELFVDRARSVRPGFAPDLDDAATIKRVVTRLDGIPLAIELAAARIRMMSPSDIEAGLEDRYRLLTGGTQTGVARQRTLEASVAWSHDLLDDAEKSLARRLSVGVGFSLEAAEHLGTDDDTDRYAILDTLTRLVDKSLVQVVHTEDETRYRLLESVQHFLLGKLIESGESEDIRVRHLGYMLKLAETAEPTTTFGGGAGNLRRFELEHDNFDVALEFATGSGRLDEALRLTAALTLFWELRGHLGRAMRWFERVLDQTEPSALRARACWGAAHVALYAGDVETMIQRAPEALEQAERFDDDWACARALNTVGFATAITAPADARPGLESSIEIATRIGDRWTALNSQKMLTVAGWAAQSDATAQLDLETLRRQAADNDADYFLAWYHGVVGMFLMHRGDLTAARTHLCTAIELCDDIGEPVTGTMSRAWLLTLDVMEGDFDGVAERGKAQLQTAAPLGGSFGLPDTLASLARAAFARNDAATALEMLRPVFDDQLEHGIPFLTATIGLQLAAAHRRVGDLDAASTALGHLDALAAALGNGWLQARNDLERAEVALAAGEPERADPLAHDALAEFVASGRRPHIVDALDLIGRIAARLESGPEALRILGAAEAERGRLGVAALPPDIAAIETVRADIGAVIGDDLGGQHWQEGLDLSLDDAVAYVRRSRGERKRPSSGWASLTPTELKIVEHVAEGLTNPQVAERMFVARGTVKVHLSHIFTKLEITNRAELAAMVARRAATEET